MQKKALNFFLHLIYYGTRLFPFQEVRAEMACIQGRGPKGKANLKRFLDGMLVLVEED